ncbi:MAG: O-linked N-acetylglucosamine transferase, SPINDLY family protein [Snowella sp.]|nr:MAG: O-linked N-acetylglucosamine transferase, SPINDLY family protein [Snowella sp.]
MTNWHPEAQVFLVNEQYSELVNYYEVLVERKPDDTNNDLYLGLAYLLQGQEEQAQAIWFFALSQEIDSDLKTQALIDILTTESIRQEKLEKHEIAWRLRGNIQELEPNNLNNLMNFIRLEATLKLPVSITIENTQVIELLLKENVKTLSTELIIATLNQVLYIVSEQSVDFARACLTHSSNSLNVVLAITMVAKNLNLVDNLILYPVDLINVCREKYPDDLALIHALFVYYSDDIKYYEKALEAAQEFLNKSQTTSARTFAFRQFLYLYLRHYNWDEAMIIAPYFIHEINKFASENLSIEGFIASVLPMLPHNLLNLQDNPRFNRYIFNQFNRNFQDITLKLGAIGFQYQSYPNALTKDRPLRIGYIGHTFRYHSVGWLCRWLMAYHDISQFEVFIYSLTHYADEMTEKWFIKNSTQFYSYSQDTFYEDIVQQIRDDRIDILIDVDSITLNLTCEVMVHKPAPIQVTWLGLDASGIPAIDYFIADPYVLPDDAQDYYSEKIWRLPHTYLGIDGFEVGVSTLTRESIGIEKDAIIFMNIQGTLKLHPDILRLQMRIVKNIPNSYLLVKGKNDQVFFQQLYTRLAKEEGIEINRLRFLANTPTVLEHRANLGIADVVLDTYPYNGATTTLETLWMEIPLVTKVGEQFAARNSYTFMINAGISEGIAWSDEEYVGWGVKLGTDQNLRREISDKLRQGKKILPLWNGKQFAREMENAYRQMWEIYIKEN